LSDKSPRADQAFLTDLRAIEHHGSHSHEAEIANAAGMNDRRVADRAIRTNHRRHVVSEVNHRAVLNIRSLPDLDRFDVSTQNSSVENTGVPPQPHIPNEGRVRGHKRRERGFGLESEELIKALVDRHKWAGGFGAAIIFCASP
jgi:hypothetical protein